MNYLIRLYAKCEELEKLIHNHIAMLDKRLEWLRVSMELENKHSSDYFYYKSLVHGVEEIKKDLENQLEVINEKFNQ